MVQGATENMHKIEYSSLHERQRRHFETLRQKGYEPIVKWECEWQYEKSLVGSDAFRYMRNFSMYYYPEFRARDSVRGGD